MREDQKSQLNSGGDPKIDEVTSLYYDVSMENPESVTPRSNEVSKKSGIDRRSFLRMATAAASFAVISSGDTGGAEKPSLSSVQEDRVFKNLAATVKPNGVKVLLPSGERCLIYNSDGICVGTLRHWVHPPTSFGPELGGHGELKGYLLQSKRNPLVRTFFDTVEQTADYLKNNFGYHPKYPKYEDTEWPIDKCSPE